ncbi:acetyl-CoA carboxylase biotin carboxyl carrier protein [Streptomyces sp. bgisy100]|uniref:acetyl-CoA carboxylase biotin carboxyl carrier protein n=1 Tax=Streptomyces sp. bgisy100 TaxID=3413783 RepID=UPI003D724C6D
MTPDISTNHHRENGRTRAFTGNGFAGADGFAGTGLAPIGRTDLDTVCRSALELARTAPRPPLRIRLQHGQMTVEMEWADSAGGTAARPGEAAGHPANPLPGEAAALAAAAAALPPDPAGTPAPAPPENTPRYLLAPTVGTFYHAPEPGAAPFVSVGDVVRPGQPVGILEVMKMMSTVEADTAGRVVEFLTPDAHPVEFQQRLIALEPLSDGEG